MAFPIIIPILAAGGAAAYFLTRKKEPEAPKETAIVPTARRGPGHFGTQPAKLTKAQLMQLKQVLHVIFAMIGRDKMLTNTARAKAVAIIKTFKRPGIALAIMTNSPMPTVETWPGSTTNARTFVTKAYKYWLAHHKKARTVPKTHKVPVAPRSRVPGRPATKAQIATAQRKKQGHYGQREHGGGYSAGDVGKSLMDTPGNDALWNEDETPGNESMVDPSLSEGNQSAAQQFGTPGWSQAMQAFAESSGYVPTPGDARTEYIENAQRLKEALALGGDAASVDTDSELMAGYDVSGADPDILAL